MIEILGKRIKSGICRYSKRNSNASRKRNGGTNTNSLDFQQLENRRLLAFTGFVVGDTLTLQQILNHGAIEISKSVFDGTWSVNDGAGTVSFGAWDNLIVNLQHEGNDLTVALGQSVVGSLELNLGTSDRVVDFQGTGGINGDLTIQGDQIVTQISNQSIQIDRIDRFVVEGDTTISLGKGVDRFFATNASFEDVNANYTSDLTLFNVNDVQLDDVYVDGSLINNGNSA